MITLSENDRIEGDAMKVLVAYFTQTGNTEKVARAIYEAVRAEKELLPVHEVKDPGGYDIIFCGFPVQVHSVPLAVEDFIKQIPAGRKIALFTTHGSLRGGKLATTAVEYAITLASKLKVLGTFGCRGKVDPKIIDDLLKKPEHRAWAEAAEGAATHPDESDLEDARQFARKVTGLLT
jgi:flavodoxin